MSSDDFVYEGKELEPFEHAVNWKRYWSAHVRQFVGQRVLEVGAGIGANTPYLNRGDRQWICLEPDKSMAVSLAKRLRANGLPATGVIAGTIFDLPATPSFDCIIYIDVLEHIKDDVIEIAEATKRLQSGGKLVVLGPAHAWLYSKFDKSIGHFRRYSSKDLLALGSSELELITLRQLDFVGILASMSNRLALKQKVPTTSQIKLWDNLMVPVSRVLDPMISYRCGRSIMAVWQRR
jgi:SAM-dependent methyltransferase